MKLMMRAWRAGARPRNTCPENAAVFFYCRRSVAASGSSPAAKSIPVSVSLTARCSARISATLSAALTRCVRPGQARQIKKPWPASCKRSSECDAQSGRLWVSAG